MRIFDECIGRYSLLIINGMLFYLGDVGVMVLNEGLQVINEKNIPLGYIDFSDIKNLSIYSSEQQEKIDGEVFIFTSNDGRCFNYKNYVNVDDREVFRRICFKLDSEN